MVDVVDEWLWGMFVCFTFFSVVVSRFVFLIWFEVVCSVVAVIGMSFSYNIALM